MGNVFVERLWHSVKYEGVYLKACQGIARARGYVICPPTDFPGNTSAGDYESRRDVRVYEPLVE